MPPNGSMTKAHGLVTGVAGRLRAARTSPVPSVLRPNQLARGAQHKTWFSENVRIVLFYFNSMIFYVALGGQDENHPQDHYRHRPAGQVDQGADRGRRFHQ